MSLQSPRPIWLLSLFAGALLVAPGAAVRGDAKSAPSTPPTHFDQLSLYRVDGTLSLRPDGRVESYVSRKPMKPALAAALDKAVSRWTFQPVLVDGVPRRAVARMRVTLAARRQGDGYTVSVDNVTFPKEISATSPDGIRAGRLLPAPVYPYGVFRAGVSGSVLLTLHIRRDGHVDEVVASQTMLYGVGGRDEDLTLAKQLLEDAALQAARKWRFGMPVNAAELPDSALSACLLVAFQVEGNPPRGEGRWIAVSRAPWQRAPWLPASAEQQVPGVADVADGEMFAQSTQIHLTRNVVGDPVAIIGG